MKNITEQYQDLLNGKMSKSSFVRSARMSFPHFVSPSTSLNDAVKILKSKRLIFENKLIKESHEANDAWMDSFTQAYNEKAMTLSSDQKQKADEALDNLGPHGVIELYGLFLPQYAVNAFLSDIDDLVQRGKDNVQSMLAKNAQKLNEAKNTNSGYTYVKEPVEVPMIDLVNPYQLKKGVEFELSKMDDLTGDAYGVALDRALKEMSKDKDKYKDLQLANYNEVKKEDESLQMKEVHKKSKQTVKTDSSGHLKKPVKKDESANVSVKKENKKGAPKGVKQMTEKPKKAAGIKKTMDMPGKEQVLSELKSFLQKKSRLSEDMHYKYTEGKEVNTPDGPGKVTKIVGGTLTVELDNGPIRDYQINLINAKEKELNSPQQPVDTSAKAVDPDKEARAKFFSNMPDLGAAFNKFNKGTNEEKLTKEAVMKKLKEYFSKKKKIKKEVFLKNRNTGKTVSAPNIKAQTAAKQLGFTTTVSGTEDITAIN